VVQAPAAPVVSEAAMPVVAGPPITAQAQQPMAPDAGVASTCGGWRWRCW
jgi:hypothetical protein